MNFDASWISAFNANFERAGLETLTPLQLSLKIPTLNIEFQGAEIWQFCKSGSAAVGTNTFSCPLEGTNSHLKVYICEDDPQAS